jgi:putative transposase
MPRTARIAPGGMIFHGLNRGNNQDAVFDCAGDCLAMLRVLRDSQQEKPMRILPCHPRAALEALSPERRRRAHVPGTAKSFPAPSDEHFCAVCRYVERNTLRANLVAAAQERPFGSLWQRLYGPALEDRPILCEWPPPCSFRGRSMCARRRPRENSRRCARGRGEAVPWEATPGNT